MPTCPPTGRPSTARFKQLRAAGCSSRNIYREKVTGARSDRRALLCMLGKPGAGDVVTVTRIDRLAAIGENITFPASNELERRTRREGEF